ncbi:MAG: hypothetical protein JXR91_01475 [Deltaproteobacteria bacterium]|nr:hypothetical protein [Deltaproteobacteria bacterium]
MKSTLKILLVVIFFNIFLIVTTDVMAYEIQTGLTHDCHEQMAMDSFETFIQNNNVTNYNNLILPADSSWDSYSDYFFGNLLESYTDKKIRFIAASLLIGVRWPDEHGLSVTSTEALYANHGDPDNQFEHFLRSQDDDYIEGNITALSKSKIFFQNRVLNAALYLFENPDDRIVEIKEYVEFYGVITFQLFAPAYYLGTAMHSLQDSFSHTVRTDDLKQILSVLNFADAVTENFNEQRDGIAHSYHMDECKSDDDNKQIIKVSKKVSLQLLQILSSDSINDAETITDNIIEEWLTYKPGCGFDNNYCNSKWLPVIRQDPTAPFLTCNVSTVGYKHFSLIEAIDKLLF